MVVRINGRKDSWQVFVKHSPKHNLLQKGFNMITNKQTMLNVKIKYIGRDYEGNNAPDCTVGTIYIIDNIEDDGDFSFVDDSGENNYSGCHDGDGLFEIVEGF